MLLNFAYTLALLIGLSVFYVVSSFILCIQFYFIKRVSGLRVLVISQSVGRSVDQSVSQSISLQAVNQSINQSIN